MCDDLSFINTTQKTLKPSKKNVPIPRTDDKKLHTQEFQLKGICGNMRYKLLQKRSTGKTTECSKHLQHIAIEKDTFSELNRYIFQISLKYIKLVIPKILFTLVLCSFNFYFKKFLTSPQNKEFSTPPLPPQAVQRILPPPLCCKTMRTIIRRSPHLERIIHNFSICVLIIAQNYIKAQGLT